MYLINNTHDHALSYIYANVYLHTMNRAVWEDDEMILVLEHGRQAYMLNREAH